MSYSWKYPGATHIKYWDFVSSKRGRALHVWESNSLAKYVLGSYLGQNNWFFCHGHRSHHLLQQLQRTLSLAVFRATNAPRHDPPRVESYEGGGDTCLQNWPSVKRKVLLPWVPAQGVHDALPWLLPSLVVLLSDYNGKDLWSWGGRKYMLLLIQYFHFKGSISGQHYQILKLWLHRWCSQCGDRLRHKTIASCEGRYCKDTSQRIGRTPST